MKENSRKWKFLGFFLSVLAFFVAGCSSTTIVESPKTGFAIQSDSPRAPDIVWTTHKTGKPFDYLGQIKVRSWSYDAGIERLKAAGQKLNADAVVDVHYEKVGFLTEMQAFAVKYR